MVCIVLDAADTVRQHLCYLLLSLGIQGIPVADRAGAERELASRADDTDGSVAIDALIADIDNKAADGAGLITAVKADPKTRDILVIAHTIQTRKEVITGLAETGVTGILTKPFRETESFTKLKNIIAHAASPRENQRRHVRVTPPADELPRLNFRVSGHPGLLTGRIRNISMGGAGVELVTPVGEGLLKPEIFIDRLQCSLGGLALNPSGVIAVVQGRVIGFRFTALSAEDSLNLARYIFEKMSA
jgi:CheY-like chemotaxis protein